MHRDEFILENGREPRPVEFFMKMYKRKDETYVEEVTREFVETAIAKIADQAADTSTPVDEEKFEESVFNELMGLSDDHNNKRVLGYGLGVTPSQLYGGFHKSSDNVVSSLEMEKLTTDVADIRRENLDIKKQNEDIKRQNEMLRSSIQYLTTVLTTTGVVSSDLVRNIFPTVVTSSTSANNLRRSNVQITGESQIRCEEHRRSE